MLPLMGEIRAACDGVDVVLHQPTAALIVAGLAVLYIFLWYVLPFLGRRAPTRPPGP